MGGDVAGARGEGRRLPPLWIAVARTAALALVVLGFAFRLFDLGSWPPGLYHDEAYNGLDALAVLAGDRPLWFSANNGREPLYIYLTSGAVALLGRSPIAVRLPAVYVGVLSVAATYALGARGWGRVTGLVAAALMAVMPWPVILGRVGFRAGLLLAILPLAGVIGLAARSALRDGSSRASPLSAPQVRRGTGVAAANVQPSVPASSQNARPSPPGAPASSTRARPPRRLPGRPLRLALACGALLGLGLYAYSAARVVAAVAAGGALACLVVAYVRGDRHARSAAPVPLSLMAFLMGLGAVALPLLIAAALEPAIFAGRASQVSIFNPEVAPDPWRALAVNAKGVAAMFTVAGDFIPRHNIPDRPVFGTAGGMLFAAGVAAALFHTLRSLAGATPAVRRRRGTIDGLLLAWLLAGVAPTLLAENAPHFLRGVAALPAAVLLAGRGAAIALDLMARIWRPFAVLGALCVVAAIALEAHDTVAYWRETRSPESSLTSLAADAPWRDPFRTDADLAGVAGEPIPDADHLAFAFEAGATTLAAEVNGARGAGWSGGQTGGRSAVWVERQRPNEASEGIWLDRRFRDGWAAVKFLVPDESVTLTDPYDPVLMSAGEAFLWPYDLDLPRVWSAVDPSLEVSRRPGAFERGDLEAAPRRLWVRWSGRETAAGEPPIAVFENGVQLLEANVLATSSQESSLRVRTIWQPTRRLDELPTAFAQAIVAGALAASVDAVPGTGGASFAGADLFPPALWPPGIRVVDERLLAADVRGELRVIVGLYTWPGPTRLRVESPEGTPLGDHVVIR